MSQKHPLPVQSIVHTTDDYQEDGSPNIVKHILDDVHYAGMMSYATRDRMACLLGATTSGWLPPCSALRKKMEI